MQIGQRAIAVSLVVFDLVTNLGRAEVDLYHFDRGQLPWAVTWHRAFAGGDGDVFCAMAGRGAPALRAKVTHAAHDGRLVRGHHVTLQQVQTTLHRILAACFQQLVKEDFGRVGRVAVAN